MSEIKEVRFLTDDKDSKRRNELVITIGGNGDWYVATVPEGRGVAGRGVRICTSGGAATAFPGLPRAIADAFHAIARGLELEKKEPDLVTKYFVIIFGDGEERKFVPFNDKDEARAYFDRASMNWSDSYLCKVIIGPRKTTAVL